MIKAIGFHSKAISFHLASVGGIPTANEHIMSIKPLTNRAYLAHNQSRASNHASFVSKSQSSKNREGHPSKQREKERQASHDRKAKKWESSNLPSETSEDWSEKYFSEKWTHTQGRLSDWNPPRDEEAGHKVSRQLHRHANERRSHSRSLRSHEDSHLNSSSGRPSEHPVPRHADFDTKRQHYAAQLEKEIQQGAPDGFALLADKEGIPQDTGSEASSRAKPGNKDSSGLPRISAEMQSRSSFREDLDQDRDNKWQFFATCHPGLEASLVKELSGPNLAAEDISPGYAGVTFWGDGLETGYRACLWLRSAIRVLVLLAEGKIDVTQPSGNVLYDWTRQAVDWPGLLQRKQCFSVEARVRDCPTIPSSRLVNTRIRDAISDAILNARGEKLQPPVRGSVADIPLFATVFGQAIRLYRDMAGQSLHQRGYRSAMHRASLNESAAAGLLLSTTWPLLEDQVMVDPMCGSGTFLIEAALMLQGKAPGLLRKSWPFYSWPDFDKHHWIQSCNQAKDVASRAKMPEVRLYGNDIHEGALSLAARDAKAAGVASMIEFSQTACSQWKPARSPQLVITNPPWGSRLRGRDYSSTNTRLERDAGEIAGDVADVSDLELEHCWKDLGCFLKAECRDSNAYVLTGNLKIPSVLGLKSSRKQILSIGGMDCRFIAYKILPLRR